VLCCSIVGLCGPNVIALRLFWHIGPLGMCEIGVGLYGPNVIALRLF
jgi:hypothetical protein